MFHYYPSLIGNIKMEKKTLDFLTPAEKLDFLQRFCEGKKSRNDDVIKTCHEELIRTHVSGVFL
jgi:hypothetical protein